MKIHETEHAITRSIVSIRPKPLCRPSLLFTFFSLPLAYRSTQLLNSLNSLNCPPLLVPVGALKMREWKKREWKYRHDSAGVENAGVEVIELQQQDNI